MTDSAKPEDKIHKLALFEECFFEDFDSLLRVPGGWVHKIYSSCEGVPVASCFIPFNSEFACSKRSERS